MRSFFEIHFLNDYDMNLWKYGPFQVIWKSITFFWLMFFQEFFCICVPIALISYIESL
jgi:hypothetical protein